MTPYYERDGIILYHADCRELLATMKAGSVDCTVTSPPYNTLQHDAKPSGMHANSSGALNFVRKMQSAYPDAKPEKEYQDWIKFIVGSCLHLSLGLVWVNHKLRFRERVGIHPLRFLPFDLYQEIIWHRDGAIAFNCRRFAPSHESFFAFGKPHYWDDSQNTMLTVWRINSEKGKEHPCPYPVELIQPLVVSSCPPNGTILDPFAGSCTTGVAAWNLGRKAILCEIDEKYCELGAKRLDRVISQGRLFKLEPVVEAQKKMFGEGEL